MTRLASFFCIDFSNSILDYLLSKRRNDIDSSSKDYPNISFTVGSSMVVYPSLISKFVSISWISEVISFSSKEGSHSWMTTAAAIIKSRCLAGMSSLISK